MQDERIQRLIINIAHESNLIRLRSIRTFIDKIQKKLISKEDFINKHHSILEVILTNLNKNQIHMSEEEIENNLFLILLFISESAAAKEIAKMYGVVEFVSGFMTFISKRQFRKCIELAEDILKGLVQNISQIIKPKNLQSRKVSKQQIHKKQINNIVSNIRKIISNSEELTELVFQNLKPDKSKIQDLIKLYRNNKPNYILKEDMTAQEKRAREEFKMNLSAKIKYGSNQKVELFNQNHHLRFILKDNLFEQDFLADSSFFSEIGLDENLFYNIFKMLIRSVQVFINSISVRFASYNEIMFKIVKKHFCLNNQSEEIRSQIMKIVIKKSSKNYDYDDNEFTTQKSEFVEEVLDKTKWNIFEENGEFEFDESGIDDKVLKSIFFLRDKIYILRLFSNLEYLFKIFIFKFISFKDFNNLFDIYLQSLNDLFETLLNIYFVSADCESLEILIQFKQKINYFINIVIENFYEDYFSLNQSSQVIIKLLEILDQAIIFSHPQNDFIINEQTSIIKFFGSKDLFNEKNLCIFLHNLNKNFLLTNLNIVQFKEKLSISGFEQINKYLRDSQEILTNLDILKDYVKQHFDEWQIFLSNPKKIKYEELIEFASKSNLEALYLLNQEHHQFIDLVSKFIYLCLELNISKKDLTKYKIEKLIIRIFDSNLHFSIKILQNLQLFLEKKSERQKFFKNSFNEKNPFFEIVFNKSILKNIDSRPLVENFLKLISMVDKDTFCLKSFTISKYLSILENLLIKEETAHNELSLIRSMKNYFEVSYPNEQKFKDLENLFNFFSLNKLKRIESAANIFNHSILLEKDYLDQFTTQNQKNHFSNFEVVFDLAKRNQVKNNNNKYSDFDIENIKLLVDMVTNRDNLEESTRINALREIKSIFENDLSIRDEKFINLMVQVIKQLLFHIKDFHKREENITSLVSEKEILSDVFEIILFFIKISKNNIYKIDQYSELFKNFIIKEFSLFFLSFFKKEKESLYLVCYLIQEIFFDFPNPKKGFVMIKKFENENEGHHEKYFFEEQILKNYKELDLIFEKNSIFEKKFEQFRLMKINEENKKLENDFICVKSFESMSKFMFSCQQKNIETEKLHKFISLIFSKILTETSFSDDQKDHIFFNIHKLLKNQKEQNYEIMKTLLHKLYLKDFKKLMKIPNFISLLSSLLCSENNNKKLISLSNSENQEQIIFSSTIIEKEKKIAFVNEIIYELSNNLDLIILDKSNVTEEKRLIVLEYFVTILKFLMTNFDFFTLSLLPSQKFESSKEKMICTSNINKNYESFFDKLILAKDKIFFGLPTFKFCEQIFEMFCFKYHFCFAKFTNAKNFDLVKYFLTQSLNKNSYICSYLVLKICDLSFLSSKTDNFMLLLKNLQDSKENLFDLYNQENSQQNTFIPQTKNYGYQILILQKFILSEENYKNSKISDAVNQYIQKTAEYFSLVMKRNLGNKINFFNFGCFLNLVIAHKDISIIFKNNFEETIKFFVFLSLSSTNSDSVFFFIDSFFRLQIDKLNKYEILQILTFIFNNKHLIKNLKQFINIMKRVLPRLIEHFYFELETDEIYSNSEKCLGDFLSIFSEFLVDNFSFSAQSSFFYDSAKNIFRPSLLPIIKQLFLIFCLCIRNLSNKNKQSEFFESSIYLKDIQKQDKKIRRIFFCLFKILKMRIKNAFGFVVNEVLPTLISSHETCKSYFLEIKFFRVLRNIFDDSVSDYVTDQSNEKKLQSCISDLLTLFERLFESEFQSEQVFDKSKFKLVEFLENIHKDIRDQHNERFFRVIEKMILNKASSILLQKYLIKHNSFPLFMKDITNSIFDLAANDRKCSKKIILLKFLCKIVKIDFIRRHIFRESFIQQLFNQLDSLFQFEFINNPNKENESIKNSKYINLVKKKKNYLQNSETKLIMNKQAALKLKSHKISIANLFGFLLFTLSFHREMHKSLNSIGQFLISSIISNFKFVCLNQRERISHLQFYQKHSMDLYLKEHSSFLFFELYYQNSCSDSFLLNFIMLSNLSFSKVFKNMILNDEELIDILFSFIFKESNPIYQCVSIQIIYNLIFQSVSSLNFFKKMKVLDDLELLQMQISRQIEISKLDQNYERTNIVNILNMNSSNSTMPISYYKVIDNNLSEIIKVLKS